MHIKHSQILAALGVEGDGFDDDDDEQHAERHGHEQLDDALRAVHQRLLLVLLIFRVVTRSPLSRLPRRALSSRIVLTFYVSSSLQIS